MISIVVDLDFFGQFSIKRSLWFLIETIGD